MHACTSTEGTFQSPPGKKHKTGEEGVEQETGIDFDDLDEEDWSPDYGVDEDGFEIDDDELEEPSPETSSPPPIETPPPKEKAATLTDQLSAMTISVPAPKNAPVTRSKTAAAADKSILPFCPFPFISAIWEEDDIRMWSIELMILHDMVIDEDVKISVKKGGRKLCVKMYFPDRFYDVDARFPKASARWRNKLTVDHPKTKAMKKCVTALFEEKSYREEDRIFCQFEIDIPIQVQEDFGQYHDDSGCQTVWSKSSKTMHVVKKQMMKSIMVDFVAVHQDRRRHKATQDITIEDDNSMDDDSVADKFEYQRQETEKMLAQRQRETDAALAQRDQELRAYQSQMHAESARQREQFQQQMQAQQQQMMQFMMQVGSPGKPAGQTTQTVEDDL